MGLKVWFSQLFSKAVPIEERPLTPLEYLNRRLVEVEADLGKPYTRNSTRVVVTTRHPDIYEMLGVVNDCALNIRQRAKLPQQATKTPPHVTTISVLLREFLVDVEGRSLGREECFRLLADSTSKLLRELEATRVNEYDYRHYLAALETLLDELIHVFDSYMSDGEAGA